MIISSGLFFLPCEDTIFVHINVAAARQVYLNLTYAPGKKLYMCLKSGEEQKYR